MRKYNHAYSLGFSLENDNPDGEATNAEIIEAILSRLVDIMKNPNECQEAVQPPWDTYET